MLAPALLFAVCDWVAVAAGVKKLEYIFKPLTLLALIVAAYAGGPPEVLVQVVGTVDVTTWVYVIAALVFSLVGDVFLMLPTDKFVQGLAAFLIAHICYVGAFIESFRQYRTYGVAVLVLVVSGILFDHVRRGILARGKTKLVMPVAAYVVAISAMVTAAIGSLFTPLIAVEGFRGIELDAATWRPTIAVAAGAVLFYISDALIGWTRFVRDFAQSRLAIMVTYHLGQMGFVLYLLRS